MKHDLSSCSRIIASTAVATCLAATALVALPVVTSSTATAAAICHNYIVTGSRASGVRQSKAKQRARKKWRDKAVSVKGGRWGDWSIASHKSYDCRRAGIWYCNAKAVPCLTGG